MILEAIVLTTRMYRQAIKKAQDAVQKSDAEDFRHVSMIFYKQKLVSWGVNSCKKTHPLSLKIGNKWAKIHSELHAITKFPYKVKTLKYAIMVNFRISKAGKLRLAKPCKHCYNLLREFGLRSCYFTRNDGSVDSMEIGCA